MTFTLTADWAIASLSGSVVIKPDTGSTTDAKIVGGVLKDLDDNVGVALSSTPSTYTIRFSRVQANGISGTIPPVGIPSFPSGTVNLLTMTSGVTPKFPWPPTPAPAPPALVSWDDVGHKPAVIASGATQADARSAIGAVADNDARLSDARTPAGGSVTAASFAGSTLVTNSEYLSDNNNDNSIPTSANVLGSFRRTAPGKQFDLIAAADWGRPILAAAHPENDGQTWLPALYNDLGFVIEKGATISITCNGGAATAGTHYSSSNTVTYPFHPDLTALELHPSVSGDTYVITVDYTGIVGNTTFASTYGIEMTEWSGAQDITIEAWDIVAGAWVTVGSVTDNSPAGEAAFNYYSNNNRNKVRYTLTNFASPGASNTGTCRITSMWVVATGSPQAGTYFPTRLTTLPRYYVDEYGADPTGVTSSDNAVQAAINAMGTRPGSLWFGQGTYVLNSTKTLAYSNQGIEGHSMFGTTIKWMGTGDCFRVHDSTIATDGSGGPGNAAPIRNFNIWAWGNSNANITGLHIGDLNFIHIDKVNINGFLTTGAIAFRGHNQYYWSERYFINMEVNSATTAYVFEGEPGMPGGKTSWDYGVAHIGAAIKASQNGVIIRNNADIVGIDWTVWGNWVCDNPSTNTGVILTIGKDDSDTSSLRGILNWGTEQMSTGPGFTDFNLGAAASMNCTGTFEIWEYSTNPTTAGTASTHKDRIRFFGRVHCASLGYQPTLGLAARTVGPVALDGVADPTNSRTVLTFEAESAATGHLTVGTQNSGFCYISSTGDIGFSPADGSQIQYWAANQADAIWGVNGALTDVGQNIESKGAGRVKENGNIVNSVVSVPASHTATGKQGQTAASATAFYVCYATNQWLRIDASGFSTSF